VSWLVRIREAAAQPGRIETLAHQAPFSSDLASLAWEVQGETLRLSWPVIQSGNESLVRARWLRAADPAAAQPAPVATLTRIDTRFRNRTQH
jgi:hypothetical protein